MACSRPSNGSASASWSTSSWICCAARAWSATRSPIPSTTRPSPTTSPRSWRVRPRACLSRSPRISPTVRSPSRWRTACASSCRSRTSPLPHTVDATAVRIARVRESTYWLGLGSNLGDRLANLQGLVDVLRDAGVRVEALSPVYDTAPQQLADQPAFLNAVVRVRTELTPRELLAVAKRAERRLGRAGGGERFGPRVADCDIVFWDGGSLARRRAGAPASAPDRAPLRARAAAGRRARAGAS